MANVATAVMGWGLTAAGAAAGGMLAVIAFYTVCGWVWHREWLKGLIGTLRGALFTRRPAVFKDMVTEECETADGESYAVWWPRQFAHLAIPTSSSSSSSSSSSVRVASKGKGLERRRPSDGGASGRRGVPFNPSSSSSATGRATATTTPTPTSESEGVLDGNLWVVLPGGMTKGDAYYAWKAEMSGVFGDDPWCVFHNPGIVNVCKARSPAGLTDTQYLEQFISAVKQREGVRTVSVVGFSAGSMLTIAMAGKADEIDRRNAHPLIHTQAPLLACCIAVHGPDKIADVFKDHLTGWCRLDMVFSLSLYTTMCNSGCTKFLPAGQGGGLHEQWLPWVRGWPWMQRYTETVFQRAWDLMEDELWSCRPAMEQPLATPVLRIVSKNDPIVTFDTCVDPSLFENLDRVIVQENAGHCDCFIDPTIASTISEWRAEQLDVVDALEMLG